uniref:Uncharacterized protein n=1 Tax=Haptolina brevifila TaxID=156173 RepID=A0A7S2J7L5_9EUKA|mmetsp:Transcript_77346/g.153583  ORF Transcript_77346/g.153583 Transcript_77346/m.153583 type:complete len:295 (+) Transcript_77346:76-960(+)|eukprot:CAMPEP_0174715954 /NCGR_PEP_ID=MMETSP1094-20130205/22706_1 /TAXON_ID=156173 /ORGANISM="Chrysochromulina brevifilum, Strain UTEX LB 985" /LENGTH=294 /DNA_ID=CAMNT_0015915623 /DNA_START=71 /DNA_END=955 /DNA_ORIENTATION=+
MSTSKKREAEAPPAGKAAGKRKLDADAEGDLDAGALDMLLSDDPQLLADRTCLPTAESLEELDVSQVLDVADAEQSTAGDGDDAEGDLAAAFAEGDVDGDSEVAAFADETVDEVGELPDGLDETKMTEDEEVDLSAHDLTLPEARRVAQSLAQNDSLATIKFSDHSLAVGDLKEEDELEWDSEEYNDVDAIIIAELLKANTSVKRLDLARNQIGDAGACALAAVIQTNTVIEYVNLESNTLGERAGLAFRNALEGNTTLQYLNLMYNSVPTSLQAEIRETWQSLRQHQQVGLHL